MKIFILFFCLLSLPGHGQSLPAPIDQFLNNIYYPLGDEINDLYFEVTEDDLTKSLNQKMVYGKLKDVFLKVYFTKKDGWAVEVQGLGDGFKELKDTLISSLISPYLYLFQAGFREFFVGYDFTLRQDKLSYQGLDKTQKKAHSEIKVSLGKNGEIISWEGIDVQGSTRITPKWTEAKWAKGKKVIEQVKTELISKSGQFTSLTEVDYQEVKGKGLPSKIEFTQTWPKGSKNGKDPLPPIEREFNLRTYKVNEGVSQKYFAGLKNTK